MGLTLALAAGYIWWSWKPEKGQLTPDIPLFEEKNHKEISPPSRPEPFAGRSYSDFKGLPMVAIVIDDLGYQKQLAVDFIEADVPLTLSFLPQAPFAGEMVQLALQKGKETLLHLPMEPKDFPQTNPGPKALLTSMSDEEIRTILEKDLETFPQVAGVNNHMGSRFTEDRHKMALVLRTIKERKLYFFDSRTTPQSAILPLASRMGIKAIQRDIFLDNIVEEEAIRGQLDLLIRLAQERGFAVACGHPYPQTLRAIKKKFPDLQDKVRLVPLSKLL
jgi:hypothetical protein